MKHFKWTEIKEMSNTNNIIVIDNQVLKVDDYLDHHPGGSIMFEQNNGHDVTLDFHNVGHSNNAKNMLKKYKIGIIYEPPTLRAIPAPVVYHSSSARYVINTFVNYIICQFNLFLDYFFMKLGFLNPHTKAIINSITKITKSSYKLVLKEKTSSNRLLPGQHVMFFSPTGICRKYTPTDISYEDSYTVYTFFIKKYENGLSAYITSLVAGCTINILSPCGTKYIENNNSFRMNKEIYYMNQFNALCFAAGSGITPIYQIAKSWIHYSPVEMWISDKEKEDSIGYHIYSESPLENCKINYCFSNMCDRITKEKICNIITTFKANNVPFIIFACGPKTYNDLIKNICMYLNIQDILCVF